MGATVQNKTTNGSNSKRKTKARNKGPENKKGKIAQVQTYPSSSFSNPFSFFSVVTEVCNNDGIHPINFSRSNTSGHTPSSGAGFVTDNKCFELK